MKRGNEELSKAGSSSGGKDKLPRTDSTKDQDTDLEQGADLLPTSKDPKFWLVRCVSGHEREAAICLMQKFINEKNLKIMSIIAIDTLKNYIYIEADKELYVRQAIRGMRSIHSSKISRVPADEMPHVLSMGMREPNKSGEGSSSAVRHNFKVGQPVVAITGDYKNVEGSVLKLEDDNIHVTPKNAGASEFLTFSYTQLSKLFHIGNRVKIVAGVEEGQMGMVLKVDHQVQVLTLLSDEMREILVSAEDCESL